MAPPAEAEVAQWRLETPGTARRAHLNNAGASLMPAPVLQAIQAHLALESETGGYEAAAAESAALEAVYSDLARLVGVRPHNIAIVGSATAAFAQALSAFDFVDGDVILTSTADYVSNQLMYLSLAKRRGVRIARAADLPGGGVDPASVRELLARLKPRLVAMTWIPTNTGLVQDAAAVGVECERAGVPYLLDACQALGQLPIDQGALKCDFISTTARKFLRGPRGIGFLSVSDSALAHGAHPLLVDMRGAVWTEGDAFELVDGARRFEQWEFPTALVMGLGAAARYAHDVGVQQSGLRAQELAAKARRMLGKIPGVSVLDRGAHLSALASFACAGHDAAGVVRALRERGINTSSHARSDAVLDLDRKGAASSLRVSPHYFNTEAELELLSATLHELVAAP